MDYLCKGVLTKKNIELNSNFFIYKAPFKQPKFLQSANEKTKIENS